MKLIKSAIAGTLESSDVHVMVQPSDDGIVIDLTSSVIKQYGAEIIKTVEEVLKDLGIDNAHLVIQDQGALDCTIKSRVQTAIMRAGDFEGDIPWGSKL